MSDQRTKENLPSPSHGLSFQGHPPLQVGRSGHFTDEDTEAWEEKGMGQGHLVNNNNSWDSLVAQWLRIHLPMQGTRVRALVWEDPTCRGATRPVSHNY